MQHQARAADEGDADEAALTAVEALSIYLEVHGLDELAEMAADLGLRWLGGTTWLLDQAVEDETMRSAPFEAADESRLLHRFFEDVAPD